MIQRNLTGARPNFGPSSVEQMPTVLDGLQALLPAWWCYCCSNVAAAACVEVCTRRFTRTQECRHTDHVQCTAAHLCRGLELDTDGWEGKLEACVLEAPLHFIHCLATPPAANHWIPLNGVCTCANTLQNAALCRDKDQCFNTGAAQL